MARAAPHGRSACPGAPGFWFQAVCQNHIVWDATEVVEFSRKHTANVKTNRKKIVKA